MGLISRSAQMPLVGLWLPSRNAHPPDFPCSVRISHESHESVFAFRANISRKWMFPV